MKTSLTGVLQRIKWFAVPYLLVLGICLIIKILYTREEIYFTVNGINNPFTDFIAPFVTDLGNGWTAIGIAAVCLLFSYRKALLIAGAYALTSLFAQIIKHIVEAPRPKLYFHDQLARIHFVKGQYIDIYDSFPSGHTVTAFSLVVLFSYWARNKAWGLLFLAVACMVGYSRMYLSEHFFEDVTGGSAIGVFITVFWLSYIDSKAFIQKPRWQKGLLN